MCLLILNKPKGKTIPLEYFQNADDSNPHGIGIAYANNGKIVIKKFLKDKVSDVYSYYLRVRKSTKTPIVIHFRYSTGGTISEGNVQPIEINKNLCIAHNGIFTHIDPTKKESDTKVFAKFLSRIEGIETLILQKSFYEPLTSYINEKLVFLTSAGAYLICCTDKFHEKDGNMYSNYGYEDIYYGSYNTNVNKWKQSDWNKWNKEIEKREKEYNKKLSFKDLDKDEHTRQRLLLEGEARRKLKAFAGEKIESSSFFTKTFSEFCYNCKNYFKPSDIATGYKCADCELLDTLDTRY